MKSMVMTLTLALLLVSGAGIAVESRVARNTVPTGPARGGSSHLPSKRVVKAVKPSEPLTRQTEMLTNGAAWLTVTVTEIPEFDTSVLGPGSMVSGVTTMNLPGMKKPECYPNGSGPHAFYQAVWRTGSAQDTLTDARFVLDLGISTAPGSQLDVPRLLAGGKNLIQFAVPADSSSEGLRLAFTQPGGTVPPFPSFAFKLDPRKWSASGHAGARPDSSGASAK